MMKRNENCVQWWNDDVGGNSEPEVLVVHSIIEIN